MRAWRRGTIGVFAGWAFALAGCELRIADGPPPDVRIDTGTAVPLDGGADPIACEARDLAPCEVADAETPDAALRRRLDGIVQACALEGHPTCGTFRFHFESGCLVGLDGPTLRNPGLVVCVARALADVRLACGEGAPVLVLSPCEG